MDKLKRAKNLYKALQKDSQSVFFGSEEIKNRHVRDYYLAKAIAFVKNKFDEDVIELEEKVNKAATSFPFLQIEIDYSNQLFLDKKINKYTY